jgi:hypothetical protein
MRRLLLLVTLMLLGGCSFIQPYRRGDGAAIADTVGVAVFGGSAIAVAATASNDQGTGISSTGSTAYTATLATLGCIAALYAASAIFGFTRDPSMHQDDVPILGLRMLGSGLQAGGQSLSNSASGARSVTCYKNNDGSATCYEN